MAKYYGSPWGAIRGSIFNITGSKARGNVLYLKAKSIPTHRGDRKHIYKALRGQIAFNKISPKQANTIRIMALLANITKKIRPIIYEAWEPDTRGTPMTGADKFIKTNFLPLYLSIPDPNKIICKNNRPDLSRITITHGRIEPPFNMKVKIENQNIIINWDSFYYKEADKQDELIIVAIFFEPPQHILQIQPKLLRIFIKRNAAKRGDNHTILNLNELKLPTEPHEQLSLFNVTTFQPSDYPTFKPLNGSNSLTIFLSFKSKIKYLGFSYSTALNIII